MSSNKKVKDRMIRLYGKKCFIEELHIRKKSDVEQEIKRYTSKCQRCIMDQLTYHHILERCKGGKATVENGALLRNINHQWFHRLPKKQQEVINRMFQEYKKQFQRLEVQRTDFSFGIEIDIAEIAATKKGLQVYNRAKVKSETRRLVDDFECKEL